MRTTRSDFSNGCIAILRPAANPRVRLLCFPHGGGGATTFNEWPRILPEDIEVYALQLPGRGRRLLEAPLTGIDQITEAVSEMFRPSEVPIALFGHSLGAWIAFEYARQLQSKAIPLLHLFVSAQCAPQLPDTDTPVFDLPDREFIFEVGRRYQGLPEEILRNDEMMTLCLPALRADFNIKESYRYIDGPPLDCPISCFGGYEDGAVSVDKLAAWQDRTSGAFSLKMFPGGHFFIDSARDSVLKLVTAELGRSLRKRGS
jgi:medium-chain acyl-[acyl-carrier-protein] hydrolase